VIIELKGVQLKELIQLQEIFRDTKPGQAVKGKLRRKTTEGEGQAAKEVTKEVEFTLKVEAERQ